MSTTISLIFKRRLYVKFDLSLICFGNDMKYGCDIRSHHQPNKLLQER